MPNPGKFKGMRKAFLTQQLPLFAEAVRNGTRRDCVIGVIRRFLNRFPLDLGDAEPDVRFLIGLDDDRPLAEPVVPAPEEMPELSVEQYAGMVEATMKLANDMKAKGAQITRWLVYHHAKQMSSTKAIFQEGSKDPYGRLLQQLVGDAGPKPVKSTAINLWCKYKEDSEYINRLTRERMSSENLPKKFRAATRSKIVHEIFDQNCERDATFRDYWEKMAMDDWDARTAAWNAKTSEEALSTPESYQRCIDSLESFFQPILDGVCALTGGTLTVLWGGPEPKDQGHLNIVHCHSGRTIAAPGMKGQTFSEAEVITWEKQIVPAYANFIRKCFTAADCQSRSYKPADGLDSSYASVGGLSSNSTAAHQPFSKPANATASGSAPSIQSPSLSPLASTMQNSSASNSGAVEVPSSEMPQGVSCANNLLRTASSASSGNQCPGYNAQLASPPLTSSTSTSATSVTEDTRGSADEQRDERSLPPSVIGSPISASGELEGGLEGGNSGDLFAGGLLDPNSYNLIDDGSDSVGSLWPSDGISSRHGITTRNRLGSTQAKNDAAVGAVEGCASDGRGGGKKRARSSSSVTNTAADTDANVGRTRQTKRARCDTPALSDVFKDEKGAPAWALKCALLFSSKEVLLGDAWRNAVIAWSNYEKKRGLEAKGKGFVTTRGRPALVHDWIQRARKPTWTPTVSANAIGEGFWTWWHAIQPEWRQGEEDQSRAMVRSEGDWTAVDVNGPNGLSTVMAVLCFWGAEAMARQDRAGIEDWAKGLDDVTFVLSKLYDEASA